MALTTNLSEGFKKYNLLSDDLNSSIKMVNSDNRALQFEGITNIRKILSVETGAPTKEVVESGIIGRIMEFLSWNDEPMFQMESTWILTNICAGTTENVEYVFGYGALDKIIDLLNSPAENVIEQATWAIGNISGDTENFKTVCFDKGIMDKLLELDEKFPENKQLKKNIVWIISNLVQLVPLAGFEWEEILKSFPLIKTSLLQEETNEIFTHALKSVAYIADSHLEEVVALDCIPLLVKSIKSDVANIIQHSLKTLRNIISGNDIQLQSVLSHGEFLPQVLNLVLHGNQSIRKEVFLIINQILKRENENSVLIIENENFMKNLRKSMGNEPREVVENIYEILDGLVTRASPEQILRMVTELNYMGCLAVLLDHEELHIKQLGLEITLKVVNSGNELPDDYNPYALYLEEGGLIEKIILLTSYPDIGDLAAIILTLVGIN